MSWMTHASTPVLKMRADILTISYAISVHSKLIIINCQSLNYGVKYDGVLSLSESTIGGTFVPCNFRPCTNTRNV